jgi:hypothetical protein
VRTIDPRTAEGSLLKQSGIDQFFRLVARTLKEQNADLTAPFAAVITGIPKKPTNLKWPFGPYQEILNVDSRSLQNCF